MLPEPEADDPLGEILAAWLEARERGDAPDPAALIAAHPAHAERLARYLGAWEDFQRFVATQDDPTPRTATPSTDSPTQDSWPDLADYAILGELGRGGMATVYRARHRRLGRLVALKILHPGGQSSPTDRARFRDEPHITARLDHPHIVPIYEVGEDRGLAYFSMKLLPGGGLHDHLGRYPAAPREAARLVAVVARAVHYAHQRGVLHRDLKPSNILLDEAGRPHVGDFGLAKLVLGDQGRTQTGAILGTPAYMAPEQALGLPDGVTTAADTYGLGAVLYALLTGRPPFRAATALQTLDLVRAAEPAPPSAVNPRLPRDLETICLKCLAKRPERRYASAAALAEDLEAWLAGEPIRARPVTAGERVAKWVRRRPGMAGLFAATFLGLAALIVGGALFNHHISAALTTAEGLRAEGLRREAALRELLYVADLREARQAWEGGAVDRARELLDRYRPRPGGVDLRGWEWHYLQAGCAGPRRTLQGHAAPILTLDVSPDGRLLATGDKQGGVRLWDLGTGRLVRETRFATQEVNAVRFAPDGATLALAGQFLGIRLWDVAGWRERRFLLGHLRTVRDLAFSPDGSRLASASVDGTIKIWDVATGHARQEFLSEGAFQAVAWSPDGRWLVSANDDRTVQRWDLEAGGPPVTLGVLGEKALDVAFDPKGAWLAAGGYGTELGFWDVARGAPLGGAENARGTLRQLAPDATGRLLAGATSHGAVTLWTHAGRPGGARLLRHFPAHPEDARALQFRPGAAELVTAGAEGAIHVWDVAAVAGRRTLVVPQFQIYDLAPALGLALVAGTGRIVLWDVERAAPRQELPGHGANLVAAALALQGDLAATGWADGEILVAETATGRLVARLRGHAREVRGLAFAPDGRTLASAGQDGTVRLWDPRAGTARAVLTGHRAAACRVQFAPDGRSLASGDDASEVRLWDLETATCRAAFRHGKMGISTLAFSPDGVTLATGAREPGVKLWDAATGRELAGLAGQAGEIGALAFSPDGGTLLATCSDRTARLIHVPTRQELFPLVHHGLPLWGLAQAGGTFYLATAPDAQGVSEVLVFSAEAPR